MRIKRSVIVYNVTVIVGISHAHSTVRIYLYVLVAIAYIKFDKTAIRFYRPTQSSVLLRHREYFKYMGYEIIIVKAPLYRIVRRFAKIGELTYYSDLVSVVIEQTYILVKTADGKEHSRLERLIYVTARGYKSYKIVFILGYGIVFSYV